MLTPDLPLYRRRRRSDDAFSPLQLSGLVAWYDPSAAGSLFQDTAGTTPAAIGDLVARVDDISGNGRHLTTSASVSVPATTNHRPIARRPGAFTYLEFDGVDDRLRAPFTLPQPFTRVSAFRQVTWTANDRMFAGGSANVADVIQAGASPNLQVNGGAGLNLANEVVGADQVLVEFWNGAASSFAIDNNAAVTGSPGASTSAGFTVGSNGVASGGFGNLFWFGTFIVNRALTTPETAAARTFMGAKAGLVL